MKSEIIGKFVLHNGNEIEAASFNFEPSPLPGVYEVIRIIDGVPLFLEKHISRFHSSAHILGYKFDVPDEIISGAIRRLTDLNGLKFGNVKIIIRGLDKPKKDITMYFMVSKYPSKEEIEKGVPVILYYGERNNPNAKSTDLSIREGINSEISKKGAYEALLVNSKNQITEGSKSNVFFVKNEKLYTPPLGSVLPGITRGYIMDLCKEMKLDVIEAPVETGFLKEIDGLFITGTSPQVLPVSTVDEMSYESASLELIAKVRKAYQNLVDEYVDKKR